MKAATIVCLFLTVLAAGAGAQEKAPEPLSEAWLEPVQWRSIGPANMGGRITDIAVNPSDPSMWWAATASGGLLKTVNNGITFTHQFDGERTVSIGAMAVAPSNPDVVWIGTGEANPRNSVSWGDGVYKSTDGGKTWKNTGLAGSFQIGQIAIHPLDPDLVYVGALGRLWGESEERGLYRTADGGRTWERILNVDAKTGVIDVQMHPTDPDTLLVGTWERQRDGFDGNDPAKKWGPGSGLWKTTDGGKTFRRITEGLPTCSLGRLGICYASGKPDVVYLILESEKIGKEPPDAPYMGIIGEDADVGARLTQVVKGGPSAKAGFKKGDIVLKMGDDTVHSYAELIRLARHHVAGETVKVEVSREKKSLFIDLTFGKRKPQRGQRGTYFTASLGGQRANLQDQQGKAGHEYGGLYRSDDGGESWVRVNTINPRPMYFSEVRVDPVDENRVYVLGIRLWQSKDGGKTFTPDAGRGCHPDHHAMWIDPADPRHLILGTDGGVYVSYDRCAHWDHLNHAAIGQFYHVAVGPRRAYHVYGGLQDNGTWGGPSRVRDGGGPTNEDWVRIGGGDGFVCRVDREDPDLVYFESQYGGLGRRHFKSGDRAGLKPRAPKGTRYRFNWNTPFILSHHNSRIWYAAGNVAFRSLDRGNRAKAISPNLTVTKKGSATALVESPLDPDLLWVGTDDGALWVTTDGGHSWKDLFATSAETDPAEAAFVARVKALDKDGNGTVAADEIPEPMRRLVARLDRNGDGALDEGEWKPGDGIADLVPERRWVSWIESSRFEKGRAYVVLDGHRSNDDRPHVFATEDLGKTWRSITDALPNDCGTTRVLCEDLVNRDLLYLGTEFGAWFTLDRGKTWYSLNTNLPTVAVHAFALHPTAGEIVAATHGRSLWALDVTPLRQMTKDALAADAHLFAPRKAILWRPLPARGRSRTFLGRNPSGGAEIWFALKKAAKPVTLEIVDVSGKTIRKLEFEGAAGLGRILWDLRHDRPKGQRGRFRQGRRADPGKYRVVLKAGGTELTQELTVAIDPEWPAPTWIAGQETEEDLDADYRMAKKQRRSPWLERGAD